MYCKLHLKNTISKISVLIITRCIRYVCQSFPFRDLEILMESTKNQ